MGVGKACEELTNQVSGTCLGVHDELCNEPDDLCHTANGSFAHPLLLQQAMDGTMDLSASLDARLNIINCTPA
eukprot:365734-Chlamydomonas_euryale.AAC.30